MAEDINRVVLVGRLTRDAELMYTNSGFALCKFSVAVNRRRKSGDQWIEEPNFFDISLWGKRGESLNSYLVKGQQVAVEGQLRQERWEQDGAKRSKITVEASNIQLLGSRGDGQRTSNSNYNAPANNQAPQQRSQSQPFEQYSPPAEPVNDRFEDDIPF